MVLFVIVFTPLTDNIALTLATKLEFVVLFIKFAIVLPDIVTKPKPMFPIPETDCPLTEDIELAFILAAVVKLPIKLLFTVWIPSPCILIAIIDNALVGSVFDVVTEPIILLHTFIVPSLKFKIPPKLPPVPVPVKTMDPVPTDEPIVFPDVVPIL